MDFRGISDALAINFEYEWSAFQKANRLGLGTRRRRSGRECLAVTSRRHQVRRPGLGLVARHGCCRVRLAKETAAFRFRMRSSPYSGFTGAHKPANGTCLRPATAPSRTRVSAHHTDVPSERARIFMSNATPAQSDHGQAVASPIDRRKADRRSETALHRQRDCLHRCSN